MPSFLLRTLNQILSGFSNVIPRKPLRLSSLTRPVSVVAIFTHNARILAGNSFDSFVNSFPNCLLVGSTNGNSPEAYASGLADL